MKIKDIYTTLPKTINIRKLYPETKIQVEVFNENKNTLDCTNNISKNIDAQGNTRIRINKLKKSNTSFDSVHYKKRNPITYIQDNIQTFNQKINNAKLPETLTTSTSSFKNIEFSKTFTALLQLKSFKIIFYVFLIVGFIYVHKLGIEYFTNSGYQKLLTLKSSQNISNFSKMSASAGNDFFIANILFSPYKIIPNDKINNASFTIKGGKQLSLLVSNIASFSKDITLLIQQKGQENVMYSQLLLNNKEKIKKLEKEIENIEYSYSQINLESSNPELQAKLNLFKEKLKQVKYYIYTLNNNFGTFLEIFGHSKRKKYVILFQNNDEIRAQGGFIGSLGMVDIFRGQIKEFEKNDVYFYEFKIKKENFSPIPAPKGIKKQTANLGLRDSNYYINDADSAEKIRFFMNKAGYDTDGIIYINQNTFLKVLDLVGEFDSKVLQQKVNSKNFSLLMSLLVEAKVSKEGTTGTPKKVLFDFMDEFQEVLQQKNISKPELLSILYEDIINREVTLYSFNKDERTLLQGLSLYNPINYGANLDFTYPVFTSISGNKSDRYIQKDYKKTVTKNADCSYNTKLQINLTHTFSPQEKEKVENLISTYNIETKNKKEKENLIFIQGNGENKQYVRVIIPEGAEVKNTNVGVTDYHQRGKSVDFFMNTPVGKTSTFTLEYSLENPKCKIYNFKFYKQPGSNQYNLDIDKFGKNYNFKNIKKDVYLND